MANSYLSCHIHYIFSTKNRQKLIAPDIQERLWPYIGAIASENKMKALAVGGITIPASQRDAMTIARHF